MAQALTIKPATGRLGILTPGMGAVATTTYAGVLAVRQRRALPIGSQTQMAHIRLGRRAEQRNPLIKDFVPLADLGDLVFGGWDPFADNAFEAACKAADGRIGEWRARAREGTPLLDAWLARAISELDEVEGIDQDARQADRRAFALETAKTMVAHQAGLDRGDAASGLAPPGQVFPSGMPTASLGEGLASVAAMARRRALPQARELRDAARFAASFALRHQYTSRNSYYLPNPERARGAFRSVLTSSKIRIDGVQHNVEFLLLVEKLLRD